MHFIGYFMITKINSQNKVFDFSNFKESKSIESNDNNNKEKEEEFKIKGKSKKLAQLLIKKKKIAE